ncbi:FkbM family methyltransferase [Nocardia farcinica]|uniref:FkbM family methyltransferase n=1 Tax=Nocardia farcinica TaxID=37329 RepID=UPI002458F856|nr:FkbM family methyltransferase [Nocardia farcinica]
MLNSVQKLKLDDVRTVECPSPAEARFLWGEITSESGMYREAATGLRPGDVALDIGANIGLSALFFADACPDVQVIAAEPAPVTFHCLERNLAAFVPRSTPLPLAVGAEPGVLPFTWYPHAPANSGLYADRERDDQATRTFLRNSGLNDDAAALITADLHRGEQIDVEMTTVSAIMDAYAPDGEIGLLKIDVERAELDVLNGVGDTDWPRIRSVVAEVHDIEGRLARIEDMLRDHGLTSRTRQDPSLQGTELYEVYAVRE